MKILQCNYGGIGADLSLTTLKDTINKFEKYWPQTIPKLVVSIELKGIAFMLSKEFEELCYEVCLTLAPYDWFLTDIDNNIEEPIL